MISMNSEQFEKLELLDTLFGSLTSDQLREYVESEQIVAILKGTTSKTYFLTRLINEHDMLSVETSSLKTEIAALKQDLHVLIKLVLKPNDYSSHSDASALKSKYNVY